MTRPAQINAKRCTNGKTACSSSSLALKIDMASRMDEIRELQQTPANTRCIAIIAHVDHGKTTLSDALLAKAGLINEDQSGSKCELDTLPDEKERGITIKSTAVSMCFHNPSDGAGYLVNLIDSPGHVDFSSEVTAALRVSDGAVVVVDCVEGVCVQTETVLRQALAERVVPVLVLNKVDRMIMELQHEPEEAYQRMNAAIYNVNQSMSPFVDPALGDVDLDPLKGNVVFGTGLFGWGFSLHQWARKLESMGAGRYDRLVRHLWGDHFWDPESKTVVANPSTDDARTLERVACKMMLKPIFKTVKALAQEDWPTIDEMAQTFQVRLSPVDRAKRGKDLMRCFMKKLCHIGDGLVELIANHLPSPAAAQKYRVDVLYEGPATDEVARAIRTCDPDGPLCAYVSKMVPSGSGRQFYAFGRVFSGTLHVGQKLFVMDPNDDNNKKEKSVQALFVMMGKAACRADSVRCGNTMAVMGLDQVILRNGTLTNLKEGFPMRAMRFTVAPVLRVAVSPRNPADLPKLVEGLRLFSKSDQCVQVIVEATGEHIMCCVGELHLDVSLKVLRRDFCSGIDLVVSEPVVPLRETVADAPAQACLTKSPNKHNRFYARCEPLSTELVTEIGREPDLYSKESDARTQRLTVSHGWDATTAKKHIWCFGPEEEPANVLVDDTKGVQYLNEVKDSSVAAFRWATGSGPLAGERVRGVRVNIIDVSLHADAIHRGGGQVLPPFRRLVHASMLAASPRLVEPVFLVETATSKDQSGGVYSVISQRGGSVISEEPREGTPLVTIKAYVPVLQTFGMVEALRQACHGQAFPQCIMDHWRVIQSDPWEVDGKANALIKSIRARKGLAPAIPRPSDLEDVL